MTDDWPDLERSYDAVAEDYAAAFAGELAGKPFDRALLDRFAAMATGSVLDVGCGSAGHVTRYLADRGLSIGGLDLSRKSIELARARHPDLTFEVGDLRALPVGDGDLGGIVAFYSVIHVPRPELPAVFGEFHRALAPGGLALIAMHGGTGEVGADNWFDRGVSFRATLVELPELADLVQEAGFAIAEQHRREPYPFEHPTPRLYVLVRK